MTDLDQVCLLEDDVVLLSEGEYVEDDDPCAGESVFWNPPNQATGKVNVELTIPLDEFPCSDDESGCDESDINFSIVKDEEDTPQACGGEGNEVCQYQVTNRRRGGNRHDLRLDRTLRSARFCQLTKRPTFLPPSPDWESVRRGLAVSLLMWLFGTRSFEV